MRLVVWCGLVVSVVAVSVAAASPAGAVAGYGDVPEGRYFTEPVQWSVDNDITGLDGTCFSPDAPVSRGETALYLWNMEGQPQEGIAHSFVDVTVEAQNGAISWMAETKITTGTSDTTFSPADTLTRAQVAAFLWRLAGRPDAAPHSFADVHAPWQRDAVSWLSQTGITKGTSSTTFSPDNTLTRKELITFLWRYEGEPRVRIDPTTPQCRPADFSVAYGDVSSTHRYASSIGRLRGLGVFEGTECKGDSFCPDDPIDRKTLAVWLGRVLGRSDGESFVDAGNNPDKAVSRIEMATFLARAFDLEEANPARLVDVTSSNSHHQSISRLMATSIDPGCGFPSRFCPTDIVSRAQMANLLARAIDWQEARARVSATGTENSINLTVTYDEEKYEATVRWSSPPVSKGRVDHYVVQSRTILEDFGPKFYQVVGVENNRTNYQSTFSNATNTNHLYAFRVIVVYANGKRLVTEETKTPSDIHKFRDVIWETVVEPNQEEQPWLADTWIHINDSAKFGIGFGGSTTLDNEHPHPNGLKRTFANSLSINRSIIHNQSASYLTDLVEEMGHVYTLTNGINENPAPVGIGHLYLHLLKVHHAPEAKRPTRCASSELYGDLAKMVFWNRYSDFDTYWGLNNTGDGAVSMSEWRACGFRLNRSTKGVVDSEVPEIAKSVFIGERVPQWFNDTYRKAGGDIDLVKLWSDITIDRRYGQTMSLIVYHLRNEFGGYCSEEHVRKFIEGKAEGITNPWKDGGCEDDVIVVEESPPTSSTSDLPVTSQTYDIGELVRNGTYGSYSMAFLQGLRNTPDRCWIAVNGYVLDVTPGEDGYEYTGPGQITDLCGQDATEHFVTNNLDLPPIRFLKGGLRS